jgi:hypothetical protein
VKLFVSELDLKLTAPFSSSTDMRVRDGGELTNQRGSEQDQTQGDLVEVAQFSAARGEPEHHKSCQHKHQSGYIHRISP